MVPELFCWIDSYPVLCWIKNNKARKPYVQQRVSEIRKLTKAKDWTFYPGAINPADLPSRGIQGSNLAVDEMWWNGQDFLKCPEQLRPTDPEPSENDENDIYMEITKPKERPKIVRSLNTVSHNVSFPNIEVVMDC